MSEVKSAHDTIVDLVSNIQWPDETYDYNAFAEIIISDRRAIIEKCRKAMTECPVDFNNPMMFNGRDILSALDSVLSEIEKED